MITNAPLYNLYFGKSKVFIKYKKFIAETVHDYTTTLCSQSRANVDSDSFHWQVPNGEYLTHNQLQTLESWYFVKQQAPASAKIKTYRKNGSVRTPFRF